MLVARIQNRVIGVGADSRGLEQLHDFEKDSTSRVVFGGEDLVAAVNRFAVQEAVSRHQRQPGLVCLFVKAEFLAGHH